MPPPNVASVNARFASLVIPCATKSSACHRLDSFCLNNGMSGDHKPACMLLTLTLTTLCRLLRMQLQPAVAPQFSPSLARHRDSPRPLQPHSLPPSPRTRPASSASGETRRRLRRLPSARSAPPPSMRHTERGVVMSVSVATLYCSNEVILKTDLATLLPE